MIDEWIWIAFIVLSLLNISGDEGEKKYCTYHIQEENEQTARFYRAVLLYLFRLLDAKNLFKDRRQKRRRANQNNFHIRPPENQLCFPKSKMPATITTAASIKARKYPGKRNDRRIPAPKHTAQMPTSRLVLM